MRLTANLFDDEQGWIISNHKGRIITANRQAASALKLGVDDLNDRSLQRSLQMEDTEYKKLTTSLEQDNYWSGELDLRDQGGDCLFIHIRKVQLESKGDYWLLLDFNKRTELYISKEKNHQLSLLNHGTIACALFATDGQLLEANPEFYAHMPPARDEFNLMVQFNTEQPGLWARVLEQLNASGHWNGQLLNSQLQNNDQGWRVTLKSHNDAAGEIVAITSCWLPADTKRAQRSQTENELRNCIFVDQHDLMRYFDNLDKSAVQTTSLLLMDISPEGMLSHMSGLNQLEAHQQTLEMHLLKHMPAGFQMARWQLGKLLILMPNTLPEKAHEHAAELMRYLNDLGLGDGLCIGIAAGSSRDSLPTLISHTEVALRRARQTGEQQICQAYTRPIRLG
ncbi:PAS domain-containing protein [Shewanella sp. NIFS-20-20]|uniref:PAS domain-containing protein n=1 Tax=Shewanella sp. NIFS-20-20 TaxID=2853806 RepID=UPI001C48D105|nr:PAS domain-containing protein [Shewanella sp. NIFS-20-20]MBV7317252.1 PAS domain-containing protein [Shewanella sp. NIFS-20-20]